VKAVWSERIRHIASEGEALKLANLVTVSRIVLIAPVLALLVAGWTRTALALYLVASCTDLCDGWLARHSGRASEFGAQLDALADNVFAVAILLFLLLAFPGLAASHGVALLVLFGAPLAYLLVSWQLRGRLLMFHFWSAKLGAILLFSLWPLLALTGSASWLLLCATVVGLSRLEQLLYILRGGLNLEAIHGLGRLPSSPRP